MLLAISTSSRTARCSTFGIISWQIVSMLDMIRSSTNQTPEAAALFYDELARIIQLGGIDPKIEVQS